MNTKHDLSAGWQMAYADHEGAEFLWDRRPHAFLEEVALIRKLKQRRLRVVLDAGCGDGRNSLYLERSGFTVLGADISETALSLARQRALTDGNDQVVFLKDDICKLTTVGPLDVVLCADCLGQIEETQQALREFHRVLRPGGILLANVYDRADETFGVGDPHPSLPLSYIYKQTLFRFFDEPQLLELLGNDWTNVSITHSTWFDPPHGDFRPTPHRHSSLVLWAEKPGAAR